eukprot:6265838-Pyramimonas_sp.AAC.1
MTYILGRMKHLCQKFPKTFVESFPIDSCPHPPWARKSGSNSTSVYEHCQQCSQRLFLRDKTPEEIFEAEKRKIDKQAGKANRADAKAKAAQMVEAYKSGHFPIMPPD